MNDYGAVGRVATWAIGPSWRSTLTAAGAAGFLVWPELTAAFDNDPTTHVVWARVIGSLLLAWFGRNARDNRVSSERAGAK